MTFNFYSFASNALRSVDQIRSASADPSEEDGNATKPIESRINTFYRALGLPAVTENAERFPLNNGNVHSINITDSLRTELLLREVDFDAPVDEKIVDRFLDGEAGLTLRDGIRFIGNNPDSRIPARLRGSLFPMYVNGDVGVFPQENRIAGAFFGNDEITVDEIKYERPLIEMIVLLRLKGDSIQDSSLQEKVSEEFSRSLGDVAVNVNNLNILTLQIIRNLTKTFLSMKDIVREQVKRLGNIRVMMRDIYEDKRVNVPDEQPVVKKAGDKGEIEKLQAQQRVQKADQDVLLSILEYDDTFGPAATKNMKDAWMASSILDLLTSTSQRIEESIEDAKKRKDKAEKANKELHRQMDLLLGTFSGLSGVDIFAVFLALFTVEQRYLLGLLNEDAIERLGELKGQGLNLERAGVVESVTKLEEQVVSVFDRLKQIVEINKLLEGNKIQDAGES